MSVPRSIKARQSVPKIGFVFAGGAAPRGHAAVSRVFFEIGRRVYATQFEFVKARVIQVANRTRRFSTTKDAEHAARPNTQKEAFSVSFSISYSWDCVWVFLGVGILGGGGGGV